MAKLTDTQMIILSTAAARDGGAVLPISRLIRADAAKVESLLKGLRKRKLIEERPASTRGRGGAARPVLVITAAGRAAIGAGDAEMETSGVAGAVAPVEPDRSPPAAGSGEGAVRPISKLGRTIALLLRAKGATIDELMAETGWQAHSVRGVISGSLKKKQGLAITSVSEEGRGRVYRIGA